MFINIEKVSFRYDDERKNVLSDINLQIKRGEFLAIVGHNGSGKSTLAKHLNAMLLPREGRVLVDEVNTKDETQKYEIRRRVGLVLQNPDNQIVASIVEEDVAFAPENIGVAPIEIRKRVDEALKAVEMYCHRKSASFKLSGGQKQRVAIAGIIAMRPDCIVLDEPTAMLDPRGREEVLGTIMRLNKEFKITIVLITHFMEEAALAQRIVIMNRGKIELIGPPREIFSHVELLKKCKLCLPHCTELLYKLRLRGFNLPVNIFDEEECVAVLQKLLEEKSADN